MRPGGSDFSEIDLPNDTIHRLFGGGSIQEDILQ